MTNGNARRLSPRAVNWHVHGLELGDLDIPSSFAIRLSSFLVLTLLAFACLPLSAAELHWRNGEAIGGDFLAAEPDRLAWRNSLMFTEPMRVRLDVLKQVIRHKDAEKPRNPSASALRMAAAFMEASLVWTRRRWR
jgi:hypothetical protein